MTKKMEKTKLSSALTFYNDKQMEDAQKEYKKKIKELEKKLTKMEDRYYNFAEAAEAGATVLLAASVFHFGIIGIPELKAYLRGRGIPVVMR